MVLDGRLRDTALGCVFAIEEGECELVFYDDLSGEPLDLEGVLRAKPEKKNLGNLENITFIVRYLLKNVTKIREKRQ